MPLVSEIIMHLILWCILFEWLGPRYLVKSIADPWDVGAYCLGAILALLWWTHQRKVRIVHR